MRARLVGCLLLAAIGTWVVAALLVLLAAGTGGLPAGGALSGPWGGRRAAGLDRRPRDAPGAPLPGGAGALGASQALGRDRGPAATGTGFRQPRRLPAQCPHVRASPGGGDLSALRRRDCPGPAAAFRRRCSHHDPQ